jgi:hypothetical protein
LPNRTVYQTPPRTKKASAAMMMPTIEMSSMA